MIGSLFERTSLLFSNLHARVFDRFCPLRFLSLRVCLTASTLFFPPSLSLFMEWKF